MTRGYITDVAYAFPETTVTVRALAAAGQLSSEPELLERLGFDRIRVAAAETPLDLARRAASTVLAVSEISHDAVGMLIYGGAPGSAAFVRGDDPSHAIVRYRSAERFTFPASRLHCQLGLGHASIVALDQLGCTTLFGAVRFASALCVAESTEAVLCVSSDFAPCENGREEIFNCTSDGACAVLVRRTGDRGRIAGSAAVSKGYYWDAGAKRDELLAAYFPTARHVIASALENAAWSANDVDWVIPHNVGSTSWDILRRLAKLDRARIWTRNQARDGHVIAGDTFINFADALSSGEIKQGDKLVLFSFGYGAHWSALAVEA